MESNRRAKKEQKAKYYAKTYFHKKLIPYAIVLHSIYNNKNQKYLKRTMTVIDWIHVIRPSNDESHFFCVCCLQQQQQRKKRFFYLALALMIDNDL